MNINLLREGKILSVVALMGSIAMLAVGCAHGKSDKNVAGEDVSMTSVGFTLVFYDAKTGNIWAYPDPEKPAELMGHLDSFDKPLITAAIKSKHEIKSAPVSTSPTTRQTSTPPGQEGTTLDAKLNGLPKNLWPTEGENGIKRGMRETWLKENIKPGVATLTGNISHLTTRDDGKVLVHFDVEGVVIWNQKMKFYVSAILDKTKPEDVIDWKTGQTITITGLVKKAAPIANLFGGIDTSFDVELEHGEVKH